MSSCINRRKLVPERVDRGGTLRYAWLRAPPLRHAIKIKPKPQLGCLTQEAPYEGGQRRALRAPCPPNYKAAFPARTGRGVRAEAIAISRSAITTSSGSRNRLYSGMPGIRLPNETMNWNQR